MDFNDLRRLIAASKRWNPEQYGYICMEVSGSIIFSNNIDCDGKRYWSKSAFDNFIEKLAVDGLEFRKATTLATKPEG